MDEGEIGIEDVKNFSEAISEEVKTSDVLVRLGTKEDIIQGDNGENRNFLNHHTKPPYSTISKW